jgi:predicted RNase H-like HicB family nuclease
VARVDAEQIRGRGSHFGDGDILSDRGGSMRIKVILEPCEEGGYTATVPSLPGCISEGNTRDEALKNIKEAVELYLEPVEDDQVVAANSEIIELAV